MFSVQALRGRGRGVVVERAIRKGETLLRVSPLAKVIKSAPESAPAASSCVNCFAAMPAGSAGGRRPLCSSACEAEYLERGGALLERCDLGALEKIHTKHGRKFPLFAAQLLAALLEGLRSKREPPPPWSEAMALCHARLPEEAAAQLSNERRRLVDAFSNAGVSTPETLELLMPESRYAQLIGEILSASPELRLRHSRKAHRRAKSHRRVTERGT